MHQVRQSIDGLKTWKAGAGEKPSAVRRFSNLRAMMRRSRWSAASFSGAFAAFLVLATPQHASALDVNTTTKEAPLAAQPLSPMEALRSGARKYYSGDKEGALQSLQYAAENGEPMAAWKLGEMYAHGDGVKEDDRKAFQYFSQIVREHGDDRPDAPDAPFVASAFVALGSYYLNGIKGVVPQNPARAKQIFTHAASYFGDADAQFQLGQLYQGSSNKLAVRWYNLAALKGHVGAQARLGETLYNLGNSDAKRARGLMWITVARDQAANTGINWILDLHERYFGLASEPVRDLSRRMADTWIERNHPELVAAKQVVTTE